MKLKQEENTMSCQAFFSFRYKEDHWRAGIVRNSWVTENRKASGFFESEDWKEVKKKDDSEIKKWIDEQLKGTSVTVVLIGNDTHWKEWIDYEIISSYKKGNGLLGIYVHQLEDKDKKTAIRGKNPFSKWSITKDGKKVFFSTLYKTYDWVDDTGYENISNWIKEAAENAKVINQ